MERDPLRVKMHCSRFFLEGYGPQWILGRVPFVLGFLGFLDFWCLSLSILSQACTYMIHPPSDSDTDASSGDSESEGDSPERAQKYLKD